MMPLEKTLAYVCNDSSMPQLTPDDYEILKRLPIPLDEAMKIAELHKAQRCSFLDNQIVIDAFGEVQLCCAVYDSSKYAISNYLNTPINHIHEIRRSHPMCAKCACVGGHVYVPASAPEFEIIADANLSEKE
ncbi:MAG: hypothetical protein HQK86_14710, partial [Nitrospinae bacterium]|nr:hypothetical protein [Nitrospinota bacterium]